MRTPTVPVWGIYKKKKKNDSYIQYNNYIVYISKDCSADVRPHLGRHRALDGRQRLHLSRVNRSRLRATLETSSVLTCETFGPLGASSDRFTTSSKLLSDISYSI